MKTKTSARLKKVQNKTIESFNKNTICTTEKARNLGEHIIETIWFIFSVILT